MSGGEAKGRKTMKAYKGFNRDMTCRGFQYKEGGEYREYGTTETRHAYEVAKVEIVATFGGGE